MSMSNQSKMQYNYQAKKYLQATIRNFRNANTLVALKIQQAFKGLEDGASLDAHVARATSIYLSYYHSMFAIPQMEISDKYIKDGYSKFRQDKVVFNGVTSIVDKEGNAMPIPEAKLSYFDKYTPKHFVRSDSSYILGLVKDDNIKAKIASVVSKHYKAGSLNKRQFKVDMRKALGENVEKITQVINTTMSNLKNIAGLSYLNQVDVENYKLSISNPSLCCGDCNCKDSSQYYQYSTQSTIKNISDYYDGLNKDLNALSTFSDFTNGFDSNTPSEKEFRVCKCYIKGVFE